MDLNDYFGSGDLSSVLEALEPIAQDYRQGLEGDELMFLVDEEYVKGYGVCSPTELMEAMPSLPLPAVKENLKNGSIKRFLDNYGRGGLLKDIEFIISEREEGLRLREVKPYLFDRSDGEYLPKLSQAFRLTVGIFGPFPQKPHFDGEYPDLENR